MKVVTPRISWLVVTALSMLGTAGFSSSITGLGLWWSIAAGGLLGLGIAVLFASSALRSTEWVLISLVAMLVLGPILVLGSPTPSGFASFFGGVANGWADVLTSTPRVPASELVAIPPYFVSWAATTLGLVLVTRLQLPALGAVPALVAFGVSMLFGGDFGILSTSLAAALVVGALGFGWWQQRSLVAANDLRVGNTTALVRRGRTLHALGLLLVIAVAAPAISTVLPAVDDTRFDMRNFLTPPWDPLDEPSPLAQVKRNLLPETRESVVFTSSGEQIPQRWALATLAHYDGFVWTVGDSAGGGDEADFAPLDLRVPDDPAVVASDDEEPELIDCLLYTSPSPRDATLSRMPSSA